MDNAVDVSQHRALVGFRADFPYQQDLIQTLLINGFQAPYSPPDPATRLLQRSAQSRADEAGRTCYQYVLHAGEYGESGLMPNRPVDIVRVAEDEPQHLFRHIIRLIIRH